MNRVSRVSVLIAAFAAGAANPAWSAEPQSGFFATVTTGEADSEFRPSATDVVSDDDGAFSIGGGYRFNRHLAARLDYHDFGKPIGFAGCPPEVLCIQAFVPERVEIDGWSASLMAGVPLGERFDVYARLGVIAWDASARSPSLNDSGTELLTGLGATWNVTQRWGVQLAYDRVDLDIDSRSLGVVYRF